MSIISLERYKYMQNIADTSCKIVTQRRVRELRISEAERRMKFAEERVRSLEVDVADGLGHVRALEFTADGLCADMQCVVA